MDDFSAVSITEFKAMGDWQQQYRLITQWGKLVTPKPDMRTPENLVKGCELPVWLAHQLIDGRHYFAVDCDSRVINGLAVLVLVQVNGRTTESLTDIGLESCLQRLGLGKHLTPSRNNGLKAIIGRIHQLVDIPGSDANSC